MLIPTVVQQLKLQIISELEMYLLLESTSLLANTVIFKPLGSQLHSAFPVGTKQNLKDRFPFNEIRRTYDDESQQSVISTLFANDKSNNTIYIYSILRCGISIFISHKQSYNNIYNIIYVYSIISQKSCKYTLLLSFYTK
ncbi:Hypothetical_protein [Hexamita inflata]|uniref:Hypothetical_protein n=1 Tax=Hexamita inflata TaxID=28002 RepID=A0AA86NMW5_9EUKA|nr:Hypothetical protein HINF_LOCUS10540 [Hexamita inflata]